ncbi:hypothetical protein NLG97_g7181 [Lecanicillium saksenae]|uniref:Uncharacterized protein n=1 Tax=Lecanicillium saksenae TaxID=468837 RepID=A0ACC1QRC5_9HYPO|nr:hypothetical protein NLG97_g7181 [Lecanicillium saksenae]
MRLLFATPKLGDYGLAIVATEVLEAKANKDEEIGRRLAGEGCAGKRAPGTPRCFTLVDWPQARLLRVLDDILQWDCIAFCLIDKERFKTDFQTGSTTYCSPILVDALLALSAIVFRHNIIDEVANRETGKPAWDIFSATLANEVIQALHKGKWLPETMPEIQALGVLALYCACHGWKNESCNFAMDFAEAIGKYCILNANEENTMVNNRRNVASTYCGAISMNRFESTPAADDRITSQDITAGAMDVDGNNRCEAQSWTDHLLGPTLVAAELYQLVEQVFKTCCGPPHERTFEGATATYIRGLEWYQNFFKHSEAYTGREPLILFVHTYYHFCILSLFAPFMTDMTLVGHGGSPPGKICEEAANIILRLMTHHDSLGGDIEPIGFMHSFKNASLDFLKIYSTAQ